MTDANGHDIVVAITDIRDPNDYYNLIEIQYCCNHRVANTVRKILKSAQNNEDVSTRVKNLLDHHSIDEHLNTLFHELYSTGKPAKFLCGIFLPEGE